MIRRAAVLLLLICSCAAQDVVPRMEQVIQHYTDNKQFMGTVLVAREGTVLLDKGYGSANLEWDIPNVPNAKFRLDSITMSAPYPSKLWRCQPIKGPGERSRRR